jgi:hypothetical protein
MNPKTSIIKLILSFFFLSVLASCTTIHFATNYNLPNETNPNYISTYEVSLRDWITYLVSTSVAENNNAIFLGDHLEKINSKLPDLEMDGWCSYTLKAFLRKDKNMTAQKLYIHCKNKYIEIQLPKNAWDSIKKFSLLDLPIVGITYEQALQYLAYKQDIANACHFSSNKNKYRYACFLPTPQQFDSIQTVIDSMNIKGCNLFNYKNSICPDCPNGKTYKNHPVLSKTGKEPTYVNGYFTDNYGLMNFKGNVAEMTSIKGIAKGGSCCHYASEAFGGKSQTYATPTIWLGFRVWYKVYAP